MVSIIDLPKTASGMKKEDKELFDRFFKVRLNTGELAFPKEMIGWADKTFGNHKDLEKQKIVYVLNKLIYEGALFNEIRSKRPVAAKSNEDTIAQIHSSEGDPFCKPLTGTPKDTFGRIKGRYCTTASNVAKYDALHGLIVFSKHNPLEFTEKELQDYFDTALKWVEAGNKKYPNAKYPFILWNCLWRAAASIIHGHMQMVLGEETHYAEAEYYNKIRLDYAKDYGGNYWDDLYKIHNSIGLGLELGKSKVFLNVAPRKDKEITIISDAFDKNFVKAIYSSLDTLRKEFHMESFNLGIIMPPIEKKHLFKKNAPNEWTGFPIIARIVDRGALSSKSGDIAGMEMFARTPVIETDPYKVMEKLKENFK
jgi:hypothetical protein